MRVIISTLLLFGLSQACWARLASYTKDSSSENEIALGLDVPSPVASNTPLAGFRRYQNLIDQLDMLALQSPDLSRQQIGSSLDQRPILAWTFGQSEAPHMLQTGGSHAREWASPEAVAGIIEQLVARADQGGIESWLRDYAAITLVPVLNPDAFIATQDFATATRIGEDPQDSQSAASSPSRSLIPRDGRMRRKNLRDSDADLNSAENSLMGVDLNRNIGPFWASSTRSSNDPRSVLYHGENEQSEPETRALLQAAAQIPAGMLRLYIDTHSFGRVFFYNRTGNETLFANTQKLVNLIRTVPSISYAAVQETAGRGIGASDEYFAYTPGLEVPSYTLEIEPGQQQIAEYGGNGGVSHSGFILPEAEVPRMREEIYQMARLAYYHQAGAPILQRVQVLQTDSRVPVASAYWRRSGATRELIINQAEPIQSCRVYRMQLIFDKPMRLRSADGRAVAYPGQAAPPPPEVTLGARTLDTSSGRWIDTHYTADTYEFEFGSANFSGSQALRIEAWDLAGMALDSDPSSIISWAAGRWQNWENSQGQESQTGGADQNISLLMQASSTCSEPASSNGGGSGGLSWLMLALLALIRGRR